MKDLSQAKDPALRGALAALQRSAAEARRIAIQTRTDLIVMRNGRLTRIPPHEIAQPPPMAQG